MKTRIELGEIDASSLSNETLNWISRLTLEIDKVSGKRVRSSDPNVLVSLRDTVGELKDPRVNALYELFKCELLRSVRSGHYHVRQSNRLELDS